MKIIFENNLERGITPRTNKFKSLKSSNKLPKISNFNTINISNNTNNAKYNYESNITNNYFENKNKVIEYNKIGLEKLIFQIEKFKQELQKYRDIRNESKANYKFTKAKAKERERDWRKKILLTTQKLRTENVDLLKIKMNEMGDNIEKDLEDINIMAKHEIQKNKFEMNSKINLKKFEIEYQNNAILNNNNIEKEQKLKSMLEQIREMENLEISFKMLKGNANELRNSNTLINKKISYIFEENKNLKRELTNIIKAVNNEKLKPDKIFLATNKSQKISNFDQVCKILNKNTFNDKTYKINENYNPLYNENSNLKKETNNYKLIKQNNFNNLKLKKIKEKCKIKEENNLFPNDHIDKISNFYSGSNKNNNNNSNKLFQPKRNANFTTLFLKIKTNDEGNKKKFFSNENYNCFTSKRNSKAKPFIFFKEDLKFDIKDINFKNIQQENFNNNQTIKSEFTQSKDYESINGRHSLFYSEKNESLLFNNNKEKIQRSYTYNLETNNKMRKDENNNKEKDKDIEKTCSIHFISNIKKKINGIKDLIKKSSDTLLNKNFIKKNQRIASIISSYANILNNLWRKTIKLIKESSKHSRLFEDTEIEIYNIVSNFKEKKMKMNLARNDDNIYARKLNIEFNKLREGLMFNNQDSKILIDLILNNDRIIKRYEDFSRQDICKMK